MFDLILERVIVLAIVEPSNYFQFENTLGLLIEKKL